MSEFGTDLQSVFDDDVKDQLANSLYTRDWSIYGSNDSGPCNHADFASAKTCPICDTCKSRSNGYFYMGYVWSSTVVNVSDLPLSFPLKEGGECGVAEFSPTTPETMGKYYEYFSKHALTATRGEMVMNLCRREFKSPCIDVPNCMVAACSEAVSDDIAVVRKRDQVWALFMPNTAVICIMELMADHSMCAIPSTHDGMSYNSGRLVIAGSVRTRVIKDVEWDSGRKRSYVSRYVKCDAVATATFTVSIVLRPYMKSKGKYSKLRYMDIVVHNIR